ncbi:hypothetical protein VTK56DRAFT_9238 [Thermocarpiscus australiensis]
MGPPPATPAPSRFLISKKQGTQQSQDHTPNQVQANGLHRLHATPRFSSTSTPRPTSTQAGAAFTTPALAIKPRAPRARSAQDIIDDDSPISVEEEPSSAFPNALDSLPEPIEFDSSLVPQSPFPEQVEEGRSPKRRRISITSSESETGREASSPPEAADFDSLPDAPDDHIVSYHSDVDGDDDVHDAKHPAAPAQSTIFSSTSPSPPRSPSINHPLSPSIKSEDESEEERSDAETDHSEDAKPAPSKPAAFHKAPRFRHPEPPAAADRDHPGRPNAAFLPDTIFSPQRRGAKYVPGGLAAELRDWLVDVKEGCADGEGEQRAGLAAFTPASASASAAAVRVTVDEVRFGGPRMTLIAGRLADGDAGGAGQAAGMGVRVILAGEGTIEGLGARRGCGKKNRVAPGAVVAIAPPAWDVELDGRWAVAYRWEVVKGGEKGEG